VEMQALQFAVDYPSFVDTVIPIATTYANKRLGAIALVIKLSVEAIRRDPRFQKWRV